jgi:hypothetical protein
MIISSRERFLVIDDGRNEQRGRGRSGVSPVGSLLLGSTGFWRSKKSCLFLYYLAVCGIATTDQCWNTRLCIGM